MNKPVEFREDRCKGCSLCIQVCPKEIITISSRFNTSGYKVVEVRDEVMETCTSCAACAMICPDYAISVWRGPKKSKQGVTVDVHDG